MRLIARRPCSFGGKKYFIGDEVPAEDVINPTVQEDQGTLAIVKDEQGGYTYENQVSQDTAFDFTYTSQKHGYGDILKELEELNITIHHDDK